MIWVVCLPVRYPLLAVAWFVSGYLCFGTLLGAGIDNNSSSAAFLDWINKYTRPLDSCLIFVLLLGLIGRPVYMFAYGVRKLIEWAKRASQIGGAVDAAGERILHSVSWMGRIVRIGFREQ